MSITSSSLQPCCACTPCVPAICSPGCALRRGDEGRLGRSRRPSARWPPSSSRSQTTAANWLRRARRPCVSWRKDAADCAARSQPTTDAAVDPDEGMKRALDYAVKLDAPSIASDGRNGRANVCGTRDGQRRGREGQSRADGHVRQVEPQSLGPRWELAPDTKRRDASSQVKPAAARSRWHLCAASEG